MDHQSAKLVLAGAMAGAGIAALALWRRSPTMPKWPMHKEQQRVKVHSASSLSEQELHTVFISMCKDGSDTLDEESFVKACIDTLKMDLTPVEVKRLFHKIDYRKTRVVGFHAFRKAVHNCGFLLSVASSILHHTVERVPAGYDYSKSTSENYKNPDVTDFVGQFSDIRKTLDYGYHVNYTHERQLWQDEVVRAVVLRTMPQNNPWVVYTCGPMGAGKGYALSWMSKNGYFPLEQIVHIDPDYFKRVMPEWEKYVERDAVSAGTLCHKESGFIQEIAQEVALRQMQHVWIDGSLRDGVWFGKVFDKIKQHFPRYSIAIFYVYAEEKVVRERCASRAAQTGRDIPEELLLDSLRAPDQSIKLLTPKVDFVARIDNGQKGAPQLAAFEKIDHHHHWNVIKQNFAILHPRHEGLKGSCD